ncbi:MAG TPA: hypothetical protein VIJ95_17950 [Hanamia sp.]
MVPFLIINNLKRRFIYNSEIEFNEDFFRIIFDDINKGENITIYWKDIKSYKPGLPNGLLTKGWLLINLKLRKKGSKRICLLDETLSKEFKNNNNIFDSPSFLVFQKYISSYNRSTADLDEQIILLPNFLASQSGYYSLIFLTTLIGFDIIYRMTHRNGSNIGVIFIVIIMYISILFQRKKDQKLYEELISKS